MKKTASPKFKKIFLLTAGILVFRQHIAAAESFDKLLITGNELMFGGNNTVMVDFNRGQSKIYDDLQLHIATDDNLHLDASIVHVSGNLKINGTRLFFGNTANTVTLDLNKGGSRIYDDLQLHIATDDNLHLDADTVHLSGDIKIGGNDIYFAGGGVPTIDFNQGGSKIYDHYDLKIETDDRLYLNAGDIIYAGADFYPSSSNQYDLGSSSQRWRDVYVGGVIKGNSDGNVIIRLGQ